MPEGIVLKCFDMLIKLKLITIRGLILLIGGLVGWGLVQLLNGFLGISLDGRYDPYLSMGLGLGAGFGLAAKLMLPLTTGHRAPFLMKQGLAGLLLGGVLGLLAFALSQALLGFDLPVATGRIVSFVLLGTSVGVLIRGMDWNSSKMPLSYPLLGTFGGLLGGLVFESLLLIQADGPIHAVGALAVGFALFTCLVPWHVTRAKSALRVLNGVQSGEVFLLDQESEILGYGETSDFVLRDHREVSIRHARFLNAPDKCEVWNLSEGDPVQVNFRPAQNQPVKAGDIISIGSAQLQLIRI